MPDVDFKVDVTTGDLAWDGDSISCVAGIELTPQRVLTGLKIFAEELLLIVMDDVGTPYWQKLLTDQPRTNLIEAMLRKRILDDEDIERLDTFTMTVDTRTRTLTVSFRAISIYGLVSGSIQI